MKQTETLFDQENFARRIRVRIAERNISQAECAAETGISKATISRICSSKKSPDVENYLRLKKWLDDYARGGAPALQEQKR